MINKYIINLFKNKYAKNRNKIHIDKKALNISIQILLKIILRNNAFQY